MLYSRLEPKAVQPARVGRIGTMRTLGVVVVLASALGIFAPGAFAACVQSHCIMGKQKDGAVYLKCLPEKSCWNGDMVVFAHGYVAPDQPIAVPANHLSIDGISLPPPFNQL